MSTEIKKIPATNRNGVVLYTTYEHAACGWVATVGPNTPEPEHTC